MSDYQIPFNRSDPMGRELEYIASAVEGGWISGDGRFTKKCQRFLEDKLGVRRAFLTTSCTGALEMAALLLNIKPGDEIIVPSFTFVSTVNAFVLRGARPVFIDIRRDTLNMDESLLEDLITPKTRAILPVHYAGVGCAMDEIMEIARRYEVPVVEDNSHGFSGKYRDRYLGTFGELATLSFHESKNFSCGEGGALLMNEDRFVKRAEIVREKGTDRSRFFRGELDKYSWVDIGSSYLPSDMLAGFLWGQMEKYDFIQQRRRQIWDYYFARLNGWAGTNGINLPQVPPECEQSYHMFYLLMSSLEERQQVIAFLKSRGICAVFHYLPLHLSQMGLHSAGRKWDCPATEEVSDLLVRLPFYNSLAREQQDVIVEALFEYYGYQD